MLTERTLIPLLPLLLTATQAMAGGPPPNDECPQAIPITCGQTIAGTTLGAIEDPGAFTCVTSVTSPGVWYTFTGIAGEVTVTTCNAADYDVKLNVYSGGCTVLDCVAGNDDFDGCGLTSQVTLTAEPFVVYHVLVQGYNGAVGNFSISLDCGACPAPQSVQVSTLDVEATVAWTSTNPGAQFVIEHGPAGFTPGTGTTTTGIVGTDGPPATITGLAPATAYHVYLLEDCDKSGSSIAVGPIAFTTLAEPPPVNALCIGALPIACGFSVNANTTLGLFSQAPHCGSASVTSRGLWYSFTGTGAEVVLSTCGQAQFDTKISVFTGDCNALACAAGNDDAAGCSGNSSRVRMLTQAGQSYLVLVHGFNQAAGTFTLSMTCNAACAPASPNDDCPTAEVLTLQPPGMCTPVAGTFTCAYPSHEPNPTCNQYIAASDIWYVFNAGNSVNAEVIITASEGTPINVAFHTSCGTFNSLGCSTAVQEPIMLTDLEPGMDVWIRLWVPAAVPSGDISICVEGDPGTAVPSTQANSLLLWPNPARDMLHVQGADPYAPIMILDLQGRIVVADRRTDAGGMLVLPIRTLAQGTYMLRTLVDGGMATMRFVVE